MRKQGRPGRGGWRQAGQAFVGLWYCWDWRCDLGGREHVQRMKVLHLVEKSGGGRLIEQVGLWGRAFGYCE